MQKLLCKPSRAFSLIEILVVIAVIAVIGSIGLVAILNASEAATVSKIRRNVQTVANTYNAAVAAGLSTNQTVTPEEAVELITRGTNLTLGNISTYFSVDGLTPEEKSLVIPLLEMSAQGTLYPKPGSY